MPVRHAVAALPTVARLTSLPLAQEATYTLKSATTSAPRRSSAGSPCKRAAPTAATACPGPQIWRKAGLDTTGAVFIDGSGLPGNLITADNEVRLQTIMAKRPDAAPWKAALPILGVDGSLAMVQPNGPAKGKVSAKTGTLGAGDLFNGRLLLPSKALGRLHRHQGRPPPGVRRHRHQQRLRRHPGSVRG